MADPRAGRSGLAADRRGGQGRAQNPGGGRRRARDDLAGGWVAEATLSAGPRRLVVRVRRAGVVAVVKATTDRAGWAGRAALRREARLLDRVRGDGVVDLLDVDDRRRRTALVLGCVPGGPLGSRRPPDPEGFAGRLRATVERLHHAGVVHGALDHEHVLLDAEGLPVLCGFGAAHLATDPTPDEQALAHLLAHLRSGA